jgi:hypothetical protein
MGRLEIALEVNRNVALKREASVLPTLYNCGFLYVLWVTNVVTKGDLCDLLENWGVKRLEVPL